MGEQSKDNRIVIPDGLKPSDGRFGSGPSKVRQEAMEALAAASPTYMGTSHRQEGVRSVVREIRQGLAELFSLPDGYEVVLGNGGATAFWDAASFCLISERSEHLVFGEFSGKFAEAVSGAPHLKEPEVISSEPGTCPSVVVRDDVDVYALTQNETSTGVEMEVKRPVGCRDDALVVVDATSAAGGRPVDASAVDAYYFSPQKCFGADGGLWLAFLSPRAIERIERLSSRWCPPFLSLRIALQNSRSDQTYNTPALATLFLLRDQIRHILANGGLAWAASRCERSAEIIYTWAENSDFANPFVKVPEWRSKVVATIDLAPQVKSSEVTSVLRANGIVDVEPYRKLGRNQIRVALFPNIEPDDVAALCACVNYVVGALAS
jgi:phosphoserine aminotransferase